MPGQYSRRTWGAASAGALAALFLLIGSSVSAGIADTRHNLGSGPGPAGRNNVSDTAEVCVFCHTPHGADINAPAPLWNKRLGAAGVPAGGGTYITYDTLQTPSLDGTVAAVGSISMACLSCHDGTQAMDNVINAPGSGGVLADGGGVDGRAYTWAGSSVNAAGRLSSGAGLLGTDLSNDHPIGIQYCGGGLSGTGTAVSGTCRDGDFTALQTQTINSNQVFWVETGGAGKQRTDLPLYQRASGGLGPLVECASCHDPHVSSGQAGPIGTGQSSGETFLRISNASSAVCTACHVK
ncbi:cytochrome c family protein [Leptothrix cholodnii SP-6]|uniref:Cytochrome c family protein n=1 Tax=Leptothrix cholodnii (strain ATCC 51168 / LMG 8142 / SP-6) TaxID=395495 RepID=B1XXR7_LEPCP|nr:cytochrome c family protein [Leptothrix cholodnii SP-6]